MQSRLNQQMNHVRSVEQVRDEIREQCRVFEQEMARLENQLEMSNQVHRFIEVETYFVKIKSADFMYRLLHMHLWMTRNVLA